MISTIQSLDRAVAFPFRSAVRQVFVELLVLGLIGLAAQPTQAQVQMDQAEPVAFQPSGVSTGQLVVTLPGDCEPDGADCEAVDRTDVLGLIPDGLTTPVSSGSGNSAVVFQQGSGSDARVQQVGTQNEASISQIEGTGNDAVVEQTGGTPGGGTMAGQNNLAVIVQNGSMNETALRQWGDDNIAGIRLIGNQNRITLTQDGSGNQYLMDFTGSALGSMGRSETHRVRQIGNNNRLIQVGTGSMPFNVRQRGNGMRMRIQHHGSP